MSLFSKTVSRNFESGVFMPSEIMAITQTAAMEHAELLGVGIDKLAMSGKSWVLYRYSATYTAKEADDGDLAVQTWHKGCEGLMHYRDFVFIDSSNNILIAATTANVVFNLNNRRLQREAYHDELREKTIMRDAIVERPAKIELSLFCEMLLCGQRIVSSEDLDVNHHVNNVKYMEWVEQCAIIDRGEKRAIAEFVVNFNNEALLGDRVDLYIGYADMNREILVEGRRGDLSIFQVKLMFRDA